MTRYSTLCLILILSVLGGLLIACGDGPPHEHGPETHSHGDEDHAHGEDTHSHDDEDHAHGEDTHSHGDEDHAHGEDTHSHDDEDHAHGEDTHSHDDEDHAHGEDTHSHGDEDHAHGEDTHSHDDEDHAHGEDTHSHDDEDHARGEDTHSHDDEDHAQGASTHTHGDEEHRHGEGAHAHGVDSHGHDASGSWRVTALGERYEIFAEIEPLIAGEVARSHTHVTVLDGFEPAERGQVQAVFSDAGREWTFSQDAPIGPGRFDLPISIESKGAYRMAFRVDTPAGIETIDAGTVHVGTADDPGGMVRAAFAVDAAHDGVDFSKEEQWRTAFATAWVERGALAASVRGPAVVRPPADGEIVLTAPVDGSVRVPRQRRWPFVGAAVGEDQALFSIVPRRPDATTPAAVEAEIAALGAEIEAKRGRLGRLEALLDAEATSVREVDAVRAELVGLEAAVAAKRQDLAAELDARGVGDGSAESVAVHVPFGGRVAEVMVSAGETVSAGDALARVVVDDRVWVDVRLSPADAARFGTTPNGLLLRLAAASATIDVPRDQLRFVARHPEVDASGAVGVVVAIDDPSPVLFAGVHADAEMLLPETRAGIVIPRSALVDDSGIDVVYVQTSGEEFERREVTVVIRQGDRALVDGLAVGERLVTDGGVAIRRATLLESGGGGHGHVH